MIDQHHSRDHDEIDLLLPWYVNQSLDPEEHDRVREHVAICAECQQNVSLLADVQNTVLSNKSTPIMPAPRINDLVDAIESKKSYRHLYGRPSLTLLAATAATVVLVGVLLLFNPGGKSDAPRQFETATSTGGDPAMNYVLSIRFGPNTSESDRNRILQEIGARDVSYAEEGSYRVVVELSAASLEDLGGYTDNLKSMPEVESARVIALQLPMRTEY